VDGSGNIRTKKDECLHRLARSADRKQQVELRAVLEEEPDRDECIARLYFHNPFFRLTDDDLARLRDKLLPRSLYDLFNAREMSIRSAGRKASVFCMPKSGSSFIQSALQTALAVPLVSLTSFGAPNISSHFGMNAREQEFDELAMVRAALACPRGYVTQNHTRYTQYLALQLRLYRIEPVVTVRNILDCLVSFDDMMLSWRATRGQDGWLADAQFSLPLDYPELPEGQRYDLLARSFGVWLVAFYLSWKRGLRQGIVSPLVIRYEEDVLAPDRLVERLTTAFELTPEQEGRLAVYVHNPDRARSRLNVGVRGRGRRKVPDGVRQFLHDYASAFRQEIGADELAYLLD
jgi:hypothetical protein